ncbi:hypothetical protein JK386_02965 [Nocardioides sp. zg-536]|uniref:Uncharacterized protein n=1 Tax=Nocardioides faecalis TaxID=2803858 RepID=A0A938Y412_9ACTN|nr:hypothetical protein [Nocardioides faecalis]MBM9458849.1 hypothetical protein [Nocardioides faecalis]QVI60255.1 hypothetical protein KG111_08225 [Nocardioides faecalis]
MAKYKAPSKKIHRGFIYLDDETVINSLSAVEAGKIDEVVAKVNLAREGGVAATLGVGPAKLDGGKKGTSEFEEEMVRTRTRFSVFELWYQSLVDGKALGTFEGWGPGVLDGVESGDTIEFRADCEVAPIETLLRTFLWFAEKAKSSGHFFSQKGDELKETKEGERNIRALLEGNGDQVVVLARPLGDPGPTVGMSIKREWLIGTLGRLGGEYTVVGQVDRLIGDNEEFPAMRLTQDVAPSGVEIESMKAALAVFEESAATLNIEISGNQATIKGPALWIEPIAIYR